MFKKSLKGRICSMALAGAMAFTLIPGNALSSVNAGTDEALVITEDNFYEYFKLIGSSNEYGFSDAANHKKIKFDFDKMRLGPKGAETKLVFENNDLHIYSYNFCYGNIWYKIFTWMGKK